jgi:DNA-binding transcriptional MerR regulator
MTKLKNTKDPNLISAVELVSEFHVSYQTINHYTNLGLLESVSRVGLKRFYNKADVKSRLDTIKELQSKGYTLRLISDIIKSNGVISFNNGLNKK